MPSVFLSYSTKDHFFAELADIKLSEAGITLWRDQGQLRAGADWRQGIENGIADCVAILVALSANSVESSFVTFEWAYAFGKGKVVIPLKLNECAIPPKLEPIQYLDFSRPGALPWELLTHRIREIETDVEPADAAVAAEAATATTPYDALAKAVLAYLDPRGYRMASFDRLRQHIDERPTDEQFKELIEKKPALFRRARVKGGKAGLAKVAS